MTKKLLEIASEIVQNQVSTSNMSSDEIVASLRQVFNALQGLQKCESEGSSVEPTRLVEEVPADTKAFEKMDPKESIQEDKIICLECGAQMRQLTTKHLGAHAMNPREYKQKWGFPLRQPLSSRMLSKARSKAAKKRGLPANLKKFQDSRRQMKADMALHEGIVPETNADEMKTKKPSKKRTEKKVSE